MVPQRIRRSKLYNKLRRPIAAVPGMVIGAIIAIVVTTTWTGIVGFFASEPYIAVLISSKAVDFEIPKDFIDGFNYAKIQAKREDLTTKNGESVLIRYEEDFASEQKTAVIAKRLQSDRNCILVIGNSNSTLTNTNMDVLLSSDDKLPFIIPIATDNDLLKKATSAGYDSVLRMLPNNGKQADRVERLVSKLATNRRVAIYADEENQSYSLNLSRDIAEKVRRKGGTIVIEEFMGPSNSFYNSSIKWSTGDKCPEVIVYVGVSHHGLLLRDQLSDLGISVPIIFTDGCLVPSLLSNTSKYTGRAFILSPAQFADESRLLPSYREIGQDAYQLAMRIIAGSNGTRKGVRDFVVNNRKALEFEGKAGRYGFDPYGENETRDYCIYEIKGANLELFIDY